MFESAIEAARHRTAEGVATLQVEASGGATDRAEGGATPPRTSEAGEQGAEGEQCEMQEEAVGEETQGECGFCVGQYYS